MDDTAPAQPFDAQRAAAYDDRIRRLCPDYGHLQKTVASVLAAQLPDRAHLLVAGAGTGTEIVQMGRAHPQWRFTAVDPSAAMLDRCRAKVAHAGLKDRIDYIDAPVEDMPASRLFDAATSLLVTHFIDKTAATRRYFQSLVGRLVPGAPLVWADLYRPASDGAFRCLWAAWRRHVGAHMTTKETDRAFVRIEEDISFVRPDGLEQIVTGAGLAPPTQFYQHLLWGAWTTTAR
ncbi:class I SAM-dependent methyltransferase [Salinibacter altiplanensis]|uniref:class I SAM-dependent methyltransferase n=1 Tax=Salinibacter altiplanensis TaxID=1803181 RepID=UPI000C9F809E|nr:class I SAM-dependent methyltransferase [Salinibacter altiplanensis]